MNLETKIINALKTVYDPEIPVNIYDLGLIYRIDVGENNEVTIQMTLTSPNCPEAEILPLKAQSAALSADESICHVKIDLVWDPPWSKDSMTDDAKALLGLI